MKREIASMLCTCLVVGLCGCGAEKEQSAAASTAGEISATEESGTVQEDELYLLSGETERGFYHMGNTRETLASALWIMKVVRISYCAANQAAPMIRKAVWPVPGRKKYLLRICLAGWNAGLHGVE